MYLKVAVEIMTLYVVLKIITIKGYKYYLKGK